MADDHADPQSNPSDHHNEQSLEQSHDPNEKRNMLCFWTVGLCNTYGSTVLLSAAYDIIKRLNGDSDDRLSVSKPRDCIPISTGVLLLAISIPSVFLKLLAPFIPFNVSGPFVSTIFMVLSYAFSTASFAIVAIAQYNWQAIFGTILMSIGHGFSEIFGLSYSTKYNSKNIILAWASGSGLSGLAASLSYAALSDIGFDPNIILLLMLVTPLFQLIAFLLIKEPNNVNLFVSSSESTSSLIDDRIDQQDDGIAEITLLNISEKLRYSSKVLKYFIPLLINFFFELIINQGLFDLMFFPGIWLDHGAQYRYYQVVCHIGVFVGRSSLTFISINKLWLLNVFIFLNAIFCTFQAIYMTAPVIWIIFIFVFFEGFTSGCAYVNAYHRIANEIPSQYKTFAVCLTSIGPTTGVIIAGFLAIPVHNVICKLPAPY